MCGIFGRFALTGSVGDLDQLCAATNHLRHRGPDSGGWWAEGPFFLGHRRLSIIDLDTGAQPMATKDGRFVIVYNGEIYNYLELRSELISFGYQFFSNSDTEVILAGYRHWGEDVCSRLIGMFAFAIADRLCCSLFVARDRFGEKPLFVCETKMSITFASEVGAFCYLDNYQAEIDKEALGSYLCLNYVPGDRTLMNGVRRIPPASWRRYTLDKAEQGTYWVAPTKEHSALNEIQARNDIQDKIDNAVRICLRSDVPVTLFLSGGIDSSIIAKSAASQGRLKHAYCLDMPEGSYSELSNAKFVAERLGIELRRVVLSESALLEFMDVVQHMDDPLADSSALAVWTLSREVAKDYKVALSGDGGDELFGGYLTYPATLLHARMRALTPYPARKTLTHLANSLPVSANKVTLSYKMMRFLRSADLPSSQAHFTWNGTWLPGDASRFLLDESDASNTMQALALLAQAHSLGDNPSLLALQIADTRDYLPNDILTKVDRTTMAFGLESRAPLLDMRVAEAALSLPKGLKVRGLGKTKYLLRTLADSIYGARVSKAKKQGFSIPVHKWLRGKDGRALMSDLLSKQSLSELPWLNAAEVKRVESAHLAEKAQLGFELWGLMVLVAWHRARITSRPLRSNIRGMVKHDFSTDFLHESASVT